MAIEMTGVPSAPNPATVNKVTNPSLSDQSGAPSAQPTQSPAAPRGDRVSLTPVAEHLRRGEDTNATQSTVDTKRTDAIRQQIANGSHRINPSQVASKMLNFESSFGWGGAS